MASTARVSVAPRGAAFRDQRSADLVYLLCHGTVDLGALTVLARQPVVLAPGLEATLVVLGASHAVELRWDGHQATEILACAAPPRAARVVGTFPSGGAGDHEFELPGLSLRVRLRTVRDDAAHRARVRRVLTDPALEGRRLLVRYQAAPGATVGGMTLLVADPSAPRIATLHSYPGEGQLVLSETRCGR